MMSKADSRKNSGGTEKFINDIEAISKALYADKKLPPRPAISVDSSGYKSLGKSQSFFESRTKPKDAKNDKKDSSDKAKKPSFWSWKRLKGLANARNRRFNCCFSLLVHSIEGLPTLFNDVCLVVHWKRKDSGQMTHPIRVYQGVAEFEEQLTHCCSINGSRSDTNQLAKYEAKHFLLYVSVYNAPELDLGKHRIDLTRLFPLTLEELEEEKSSGKWTTSFRLSGKARGATLNVSFGYVVIGNNGVQPCGSNNVPDILSLRQNSAMTENFMYQSDHMEEVTIRRAGSLPAKLSVLNQSPDIKDLHEVLPEPSSELCEYVNILYQKLDEMSNASIKNKLDVDPHKLNSFTPPESEEKVSETEWEISDFSVVEKGIEEFTKEEVRSEENFLKVAQASGAPETDDYGSLEVPLNDDALHTKAEEIEPLREEKLISTCNSTEEKNEPLSKESIMRDLETALSYATELMNGLVDSQEDEGVDESEVVHQVDSLDTNSETALSYATELMNGLVDSLEDEGVDESEVLHQVNSLDTNSHLIDCREGGPLSLDEVTDSVASDFLKMLGIEHSPVGLSSESETDSPRERLLRQFEMEVLANGSLLNLDIDNEPEEFVSNIPMGSSWEAISNSFYESSICDGFQEFLKIETDAFKTKARASRLEDLETEALMRDWGLNEMAFQHSPPRKLAGFGSPLDMPPEDHEQLPPLVEGLGPFLQTKNGGFLRSMNPALFRNAKSGGSLIMQVSSPVVVPAEMGSGVMDILKGLAAMGIEKLSMQANKLMPLEDITGKTIRQIAWEAAPSLEGPERQGLSQHESQNMQNLPSKQKRGKGISSVPVLGKSGSTLLGSDTEYVSLEDLAPLAMDKIEALSIEGLRIQSGMSDNDAPSNFSTESIGEFSALNGMTLDVGGSMGLDGTCGLQLMDIKDKCEDIDGLMGLSLTLDEWVKLDSGEIDEDDLVSERTYRVLAAHHATSLDQFRGRQKGEKRRGRGREYGLLGNNFTVALLVQLRDPLRNYEPVGTPMLGLIQVERLFVPPRPKLYSPVSLETEPNVEEEEELTTVRNDNIIEKPTEEKIHEEELIPQYKITEVHVAGLKMEPGKRKLWGSTNQQQAGSRWLLANGMGKKNKHPLMKSKTVVKNSCPAFSTLSTTTVQPGDTLWSISSRVYGTGSKWKELAALNPHIRNPNIILYNETTIRLC